MLRCSRERCSLEQLPATIIISIFLRLVVGDRQYQAVRAQGNLRAQHLHDASDSTLWQSFSNSLWGQIYPTSFGTLANENSSKSKVVSISHANSIKQEGIQQRGIDMVLGAERMHMPGNTATAALFGDTVQPKVDITEGKASTVRANMSVSQEFATTDDCFTRLTPGYQLYSARHNDISNKLGGRKLVKSPRQCRQLCRKYACASLEVHLENVKGVSLWACWLSSVRANTFMGGTLEKTKTQGWYYQEVKFCCKAGASSEASKATATSSTSQTGSDTNRSRSGSGNPGNAGSANSGAAEDGDAGSCCLKVGDHVKVTSSRRKLDQIYRQHGVARMLSASSSGIISKVDLKGRVENVVLLKREGRDYWVPIKALVGFGKCDKVVTLDSGEDCVERTASAPASRDAATSIGEATVTTSRPASTAGETERSEGGSRSGKGKGGGDGRASGGGDDTCSIKVGDRATVMSNRRKLDQVYRQHGVARMLSPGSKGIISKVDIKGKIENVVLLKRQGRDYWVPIKALVGFENCNGISVK